LYKNYSSNSNIFLQSPKYLLYFKAAHAIIIESQIVCEVRELGVSYNKLFKILIDKNMKKGDLCAAAGISPSSLAKLRNGENVNTDILVKICRTLHCEPGDIMELSHDNELQQISL